MRQEDSRITSRYALTDKQWAQVAELVPGKKTDGGRTAVDNHPVVVVVIYGAKTAIPWRDLPVGYGEWNSVCWLGQSHVQAA